MRVYEDRFRNPDEGDDTFVLTLHDDGRFEYDLTTANYAWMTGSTATGRWTVAEGMLELAVEKPGATLVAGRTYRCPFHEDQLVIEYRELPRRR